MRPDDTPYPLTVGLAPPPPYAQPVTATVVPQATAPLPPVRTRRAIATLLLLATVMGETIATFNTPPIKYLIAPGTFFWLLAFYGTGIVLVREIAQRRQLGLGGFVLLGTAFAFFNEGVIAGTWYSVKPTGYAYILGLDWGWALLLTFFHITYSTAIPIALAEVANPRIRQRHWLNTPGLVTVTIIFLLVSGLGLVLPNYHGARSVVYLLGVGLGLLALRLPPRGPTTDDRPPPPLWRLRGAGALGTMLLFGTAFLLPGILSTLHLRRAEVVIGQVGIVLALCLVFTLGFFQLARWSRSARWTGQHTLALALGALIPIMLISFPFWATGEPFAELAMLIALIWLARRPGTSLRWDSGR